MPATPVSHRMTEQVMYTCRHMEVKSDKVGNSSLELLERQRGTIFKRLLWFYGFYCFFCIYNPIFHFSVTEDLLLNCNKVHLCF